MRIRYYSDTDTLYIELSETFGSDSRECAKDMVVDLDANGVPVGIEIEHAKHHVDLSMLQTDNISVR